MGHKEWTEVGWSLVALRRWSLNKGSITCKFYRADFEVAVHDRWSLERGRRMGRFDCTYMA